MNLFVRALTGVILATVFTSPARAVVTTFFNGSQIATLVSSGTNLDTISSEGYLFTYTRDKLFTGGLGPDPIGRTVHVPWPTGVEAQGITTGPNVGIGAQITIQRVDGALFDLTSFTAKLLANTAGAGGSIEIMPLSNGEDMLPNPVAFDASGNYGASFSYNQSVPHQNTLNSTVLLKNADTYVLKLYVDWALTALTLDGPPVLPTPEPSRTLLLAFGIAGILFRRDRHNHH